IDKDEELAISFIQIGSDPQATKFLKILDDTFKSWLIDFCLKPNFLRAVLELTVFYPEGRKSELAENRMKAFINQHFELKIYKYKGIVRKMA
ncbi:MAG: hypothetical protein RLO12_05965, partial [Fulvivirga sp.]